MPLLPDGKVARARYGVHPTTLWRWDQKPELGFPPPRIINGRKYRDLEELDAFDKRVVRSPDQQLK
jgi:hypothetical protein